MFCSRRFCIEGFLLGQEGRSVELFNHSQGAQKTNDADIPVVSPTKLEEDLFVPFDSDHHAIRPVAVPFALLDYAQDVLQRDDHLRAGFVK